MTVKSRIYVDFWNFQLTSNEEVGNGGKAMFDWKKIAPFLIDKTQEILDESVDYRGMTVYLSYNASDPRDGGLRGWAHNVLAKFPGIEIKAKVRRQKGHPKCQSCHEEISECPHCGEALSRTVEKGIDTAIVTDMLSESWEGIVDVPILVSSDKDYIPAVEYLKGRGIRVVNAYWPPVGTNLATQCWANIDLVDGHKDFLR